MKSSEPIKYQLEVVFDEEGSPRVGGLATNLNARDVRVLISVLEEEKERWLQSIKRNVVEIKQPVLEKKEA